MIAIKLVLAAIIAFAIPYKQTDNIPWESESSFLAMSGCAAYYSRGKMAQTAAVLGMIEKASDYNGWLSDNGYIGAVAVYRRGDRGKEVHILWPDGTIDGPYIAIDVVALHHYELGLKRNRVIDVDYAIALAHNIRGPMNVTILYNMGVALELAYGTSGEIDSGITTDNYKGCLGK